MHSSGGKGEARPKFSVGAPKSCWVFFSRPDAGDEHVFQSPYVHKISSVRRPVRLKPTQPDAVWSKHTAEQQGPVDEVQSPSDKCKCATHSGSCRGSREHAKSNRRSRYCIGFCTELKRDATSFVHNMAFFSILMKT